MMLGKNTQSKEIINRLPKNNSFIRMAELGVWKGESSELFSKHVDRLYLVDIWKIESYLESGEFGPLKSFVNRYKKLVGSDDPKDFEKYYNKIYDKVKEKFKNNSHVSIHRMTTNDFCIWFKQTNQIKLDCVYLDASHEYRQVYEDLKNCWSVLLKENGILFGDDYLNKPGVKKAVDQFMFENEEHYTFNNFYENQYEIIKK